MNVHGQGNDGWIGALLVGAVGAVVSLPAMLLVLPLIALARWRRLAMFAAALIGLGVTVLLWSRITGEMEAGLQAMRRAGGFWADPERALKATWPHVWVWWLMALGLGPRRRRGDRPASPPLGRRTQRPRRAPHRPRPDPPRTPRPQGRRGAQARSPTLGV